MTDDRTALAEAVDRLEAITARLAAEELDAGELKGLAEDALAASARVTELLPRVIRQIERASEGAAAEAPDAPAM
jgi:hypothetical protein